MDQEHLVPEVEEPQDHGRPQYHSPHDTDRGHVVQCTKVAPPLRPHPRGRVQREPLGAGHHLVRGKHYDYTF